MLPIREASYRAKSLKTLKDEIGEKAGVSLDEVAGRVERAYSATETGLYDRLGELFKAMDKGDPVLNVPTYNGGLFNTIPDDSDKREQRIARFLQSHKVPDGRLALAIDRLSRDQDERTLGLVPIDYKSLEVRHLGSIYEGLLEFKLILADEDKTTQTEKGQERYISLSEAKVKRGRQAEVVVRKGEVYLSNDKAERKASGSYYTPDPIVEYIVANTVGPVLDEKLNALVPDFRKVRKTFDNEVQKATAYPPQGVSPKDKEAIRRFAEEKTYATHKDLVERLFDLKVIDPAMGSGHFLVEAVDFVTDRLLKFLSGFPKNPVSFALERTRNGIMESLGDQGVTVDSDKLTDINLLKRHVLKRCIYGVDLNPMAVELAKVSLWLDAFTLGAPLSFLDHHLRCGNSLVGATFAQLENATSGRLFRLDYEPLLRAINYVLLVSKLSDTTAAEVARSVTQYDQARQSLSGYRIVLDLLVADHFGISGAQSLVSLGKGLDLTDRDRFIVSLESDRERRLVAQVEALALRPDRRFFHWEIEFPEVFFGFADASERQIKHKNKIEAGSAGFDAVVGNPPYINAMELSRNLSEYEKPYWKDQFASAKGAYDIFILFIEKSTKLLRADRRCGVITPNKYLSAPYAVGLREFLMEKAEIDRLYDVSRVQIFEDPAVYPVVTIVRSSLQGGVSPITVEQSLKSIDDRTTHTHDRALLRLLPELIWGFLLSEGTDLLVRIIGQSAQFGSICQINASTTAGEADLYGGLLVENQNQVGVEGWRAINTGLIDRYKLRWGTGEMTHGGQRYDYPFLPDDEEVSQNRRGQYNRTKIVFAKVANRIEAAFDVEGNIAGLNINFAFCGGDEAYFYLALLNSKLMTWIYSQFFGALRMSGGYFQFQSPQLRVLPLMQFSQELASSPLVGQIISLSKQITSNPGLLAEVDNKIDDMVHQLYGLRAEEIAQVRSQFI